MGNSAECRYPSFVFPSLHWLLHTDVGLFTRILIGSAIFAWLAIVDLRRHGRSATKWREYSLLLIAVAVAMAYGAINDQITVTISPEYYLSRSKGTPRR